MSNPKSQARGRPVLSDEEVAERRRHIAACALRLFQAEGYHAVSMRRLALEADCTVMTLYKYFDRKIDVLRQLWGEVFCDLFDQLDLIAARQGDGQDDDIARLNDIAFGYVRYWLEHREHYFLVFMSHDVSQPDVSIFVEDGGTVARFSLFYECVAKALKEETELAVVNIKVQSLICALNGIAHNVITISGFEWADPKQLVHTAVSGVLNA